ncbi:MAG: hypothetical protein H0V01_06715 [Bacteroidetes bacterium]|nr:hypothetical protein [Bacteroidota bacterium]HET6244872.1 C4-type zinc ribbon domain-containing protein [Bacteroidia bacterium]
MAKEKTITTPEKTKAKKSGVEKEVTVEDKLKALFNLQQVDSKIDKIRTIRGELPLEVQDLEDELQGLDTRLNNLTEELKALETQISDKKNLMKESEALIKKYEAQQGKVRNNREYDSLTKEIEFQKLEIELAEKRIKEHKASMGSKKDVIDQSTEAFTERKKDLQHKKAELDTIIAETQKEEDQLISKSKKAEAIIEDRLLLAYKRIRKNALNGLAVVAVERDACGGCFNKIPPQRQLDIKTHKKIIVCEYCGRVLVDANILTDVE